MKTRSRNIAAFTLVELLVVISIVAVLIAMLLPALRNAREAGYASVCGGNLHQTYLAFAAFGADTKGRVPPNRQYGAPGWGYYWQFLGNSYLGASETYSGALNGQRYRALKCPGEKGIACVGDPLAQIMPMYNNPWVPTSYMMNVMINYGAWFEDSYARFGERSMGGSMWWGTSYPGNYSVKSPEQFTFMLDTGTPLWGWGTPEFAWNVDNQWGIDNHPQTLYAFRHPGDTASALYYDGHVVPTKHALVTNKLLFNWKYP